MFIRPLSVQIKRKDNILVAFALLGTSNFYGLDKNKWFLSAVLSRFETKTIEVTFDWTILVGIISLCRDICVILVAHFRGGESGGVQVGVYLLRDICAKRLCYSFFKIFYFLYLFVVVRIKKKLSRIFLRMIWSENELKNELGATQNVATLIGVVSMRADVTWTPPTSLPGEKGAFYRANTIPWEIWSCKVCNSSL